jgi:hypothetical protein
MVNAFVQGERWLIPVLRQTSQNNVTGQIQLTYHTPLANPFGLSKEQSESAIEIVGLIGLS